ncbi:penicillin-binding transpeptidase domain-containing protein [Bombilactobacillus bombi]|uniref:penicillin-binding transpeptidase domain-containing protein n=1 Tax=Bombilactobacillus bombi TaxID=1303590 RepID=UPI0015E62841|nr:penicillin-binding transpeptidase domain-containing protein [Bombilactobacillus bombi]MBA1434358.1 PASTA domain-containing protein [Bombilactobacillus bombi]
MKYSKKQQYIIKKARRDRRIIGLFFLGVIALFFIYFMGRFTYIAVSGHVGGVNLAQRTTKKYRHQKTLWAQRGTIYAYDGSKLAFSDKTYRIYAVIDKKYVGNNKKPLYVTDKKRVAQVLSKYIALSPTQIYQILTPNINQFQVEFGNAGDNLSLNVKKAIESYHLPGIYFYSTPSRSYPNGSMAANTIGLVQMQNVGKKHLLNGSMGLEQYFNRQLQGKNGYSIRWVDPQGYTLPKTREKTKPPRQGKNIYTTIDPNYQYYLEQLVTQVNNKYQPHSMQAFVTNPKTGDILAITQRPTFDPTTKVGLNNAWRNINVQDQFEPGSVMKVMTLAAAIESHHYNPNQYYHSGAINIGGRVVKDWNQSGWGDIPLEQAFVRSSNVGMVFLEQQMGANTWLKYLKKFHIGQKTNITLPGEVSGNINFQHLSDQAITAFGQSVDVTGVQMLQALGAIGNHGKMMKPRIVSQIEDPNSGKIIKNKVQKISQPVSATTANKVLDAMRDVVQKKYGTGTVYNIDGQDIAVKTGTAQIAGANGGYLTGGNSYIYSVAGLAPASNPKYLVYITMQQPQNMDTSAEKILSEIFNPMMQRLLGTGTIENVKSSPQTILLKDVTGQSVAAAQQKLQAQQLNLGVIGTGGTVVQQLPTANSKILVNQRVVLLTNGAMTMPDVTGWSKNDLLKLSEITGKKIVLKGQGFAVQQNISAGTVLNNVKQIEINLN